MQAALSDTSSLAISLPDPGATLRLAEALAALAQPGLVVLLDGPVGAGKTTLARQTIQTLLAQAGRMEDIPSPTFTIVQTYEAQHFEVWHADLYRLTSTSELTELGLDEAFDTAFCLIEWPDRLGAEAPDHLRIDLSYGASDTARAATLTATGKAKVTLTQLRQALAT